MITAPSIPVADASAEVDELRRLVKRRERELDEMSADLERAESDARDYEHQLHEALAQVERMDERLEHLSTKPFRPDVKRMDAGDWTHASSICVCDACGYQYWEHAHVPGYEWVHRLCDGRLVKL
jgi:predicted nuclease with TOPRIM domain